MIRFATVKLLLALFLALPAVVHARTEHRFHSGACTDGGGINEWYTVTTYVDGNPTYVTGRDCDGKYFEYEVCGPNGWRVVGNDPLLGTGPISTGECEGAGAWKGEVIYNTRMVPVGLRFQVCTGQYYVIDDVVVTYPEIDPTTGLN